jgi:hypothetical protein
LVRIGPDEKPPNIQASSPEGGPSNIIPPPIALNLDKETKGSSNAEETEEKEDDKKATKADDAAVNVLKWNGSLSKVTGVSHTKELDNAARVL